MLPASVPIWLAAEPVDMRLGIDGLSAIVAQRWKLDPYAGHLFLFVGRRKDRIKILVWDRSGFTLYYKRLERGRFQAPKPAGGGVTAQIDSVTLAMMLDGIDVRRVARPSAWAPPSRAA